MYKYSQNCKTFNFTKKKMPRLERLHIVVLVGTFALAVHASQVEPRAFVVAASEHRPIHPLQFAKDLISRKLDEYEDAVISAVGEVSLVIEFE